MLTLAYNTGLERLALERLLQVQGQPRHHSVFKASLDYKPDPVSGK